MVTRKIGRFFSDNARIFSIVLGLGLLSVFGFSGTVGASGSAYFVVSGGGSYKVGSTVTATVYESAPGTDNVNAAQANLTYTSSLLTYESISIDGPFTLCTQQSGGGGSVSIACAATSAQSGEKAIAKITFKAKAKGTAHVDIAGGSDIDNTSGTSVWNGSYPGSTYTLTETSTSSSSGGSTNTSTKPSTTTKTTTTPKKTTTTTPTNTVPTTTPTNAAAPSASATASYSITVTGSNGQPIANAKVSLDSNISATTNSLGKATFNEMGTGTYNIKITAPGKKPYTTTLVLTANENKVASVKLASAMSTMEYIIAGVLLLVILGAVGFMIYKKRHPRFKAPQGPTATPPPPVAPITPTTPSAPTTPGMSPQGGPQAPASRMSSYSPREVAPAAARIVDQQPQQATWPPVIGNSVN